MQSPTQRIETPPAAPDASAAEPSYYTMPEEYRHGAAGKRMAEPRKDPVAPPPPSVVPPVAPKPVAVPAQKKSTGRNRALIVAGVLFVLLLGAAGYAAVRLTAPKPVQPAERPAPVTRPAPDPAPPTQPAPTPEPDPTPEPSPFPTAATPGTDTDSDGLTDLEERAVYQTDARLPDTDVDGFLDGNEVFHRYNPGGTAPGMLSESGLVRTFTGPVSDAPWYRILYPSVWTVVQHGQKGTASTDANDWGASNVFSATTGEEFVLTVIQPGTSLAAYVAGEEPGVSFDEVVTKNGYAAMISEDQLTVYIAGSATSSTGPAGYAVKIEYDPGIKATVDYLQTFKMMTNALEWL